MSKNIWVYLMMIFVSITVIAFVKVVSNNVLYAEMWTQKCKDGGGVTVTTPNGYICINPTAIVEVD